MANTTLSVDVWSDIACPWCYIGKRNLEAALQEIEHDADAPEVEVTYHSYELSPETPAEVEGRHADLLAQAKNLSVEQAEGMLAHVTAVAEKAGLSYDFDALQSTNTVLAHELLHFARAQGRQHEMKERIMAAYFTEGRHVGRIDSLVELAGEVGLDQAAAREALEQHTFLDDVRRDQAQAATYGIQGVPFFVIDGKYGVSGAQPTEAFTQVLRQVWAERQQ